MRTNFIIKERRSGKTTQLLLTSEATGYPIVVSTERQARDLIRMSEDMNLNIPAPMTVEWLRHGKKPEKILIDEGYGIICDALKNYLGTDVVAITFTN